MDSLRRTREIQRKSEEAARIIACNFKDAKKRGKGPENALFWEFICNARDRYDEASSGLSSLEREEFDFSIKLSTGLSDEEMCLLTGRHYKTPPEWVRYNQNY